MFQGETNAGAAFWDGAADYYQKFETLDNAWKLAFPALQQRYLFQIRPGGYWIGATLLTCLQVSEAQRRVAEYLPGWQIMSSTGMNHDSTHYFYQNGYERAGHDIFRLVAKDLYGAPELPNIYPPAPGLLRSSWCDPTKILLQLQHPDDFYQWTPGWESDFRLEGATHISVTAGAIHGNILTLSLSGTPGTGFTGLSYTAHPGGSAAPVKNANGIGMLTFYNLSVSPGSPVVLSDTTILGDNGSGNGAIEVEASGGIAPYTYLWSTGSTSPAAPLLAAGTYTVTITDADLCSQSFEVTVPMLVAVSEGAYAQETRLFPNPCSDYFDLHLPQPAAGTRSQIRLSDPLGKEVLPAFESTGERTRVYTTGLPPGLYSVRLYADGVLRWSGVVVKQ
ncbi:MAG: hypothetical protein IT260_21980 [Saprospiraceae bacterium]|nr:hypothetical protein [Saprospiraceae bacterium]